MKNLNFSYTCSLFVLAIFVVAMPFSVFAIDFKGATKNLAAKKAFGFNLNSAGLKDLTSIPGIGETLAKKIILYRYELGGFSAWKQLKNVSGINDSILSKLKKLIKLGRGTTPTPLSTNMLKEYKSSLKGKLLKTSAGGKANSTKTLKKSVNDKVGHGNVLKKAVEKKANSKKSVKSKIRPNKIIKKHLDKKSRSKHTKKKIKKLY